MQVVEGAGVLRESSWLLLVGNCGEEDHGVLEREVAKDVLELLGWENMDKVLGGAEGYVRPEVNLERGEGIGLFAVGATGAELGGDSIRLR